MLVTFISECEKNSLKKTRRVLDAFANRIGNNTWQTPITQEGLEAVKKLLKQTASKNTAVSCHQLKSRVRTELLWVVGKRNKFNNEGVVAVNYTEQDKFIGEDSNMLTAEIIASSSTIAGLFHDFGKANILFQNKLNPKKKKDQKNYEPYRHEWVSLRLFQAFAGECKTDSEWLNKLSQIKSNTFSRCFKDGGISDNHPINNLPPFAQLVAWLVVTHHRLPLYPKWKENLPPNLKNADDWFGSNFEPIWNSYNCKNADLKEFGNALVRNNWHFLELPYQSAIWRANAREIAKNIQIPKIVDYLNEQLFTIHFARLCLILADHYSSSLSLEKIEEKWRDDSYEVWANTDRETKQYKQKLDEHLIGVAYNAQKIAQALPKLNASLNSVEINKKLTDDVPKEYKDKFGWQDKAKKLAKKVGKQTIESGFFGINMASTGRGKTLANAKIMTAIGSEVGRIRFSVALGLRTLTLQTGIAYRKELDLKNELAIMVGGIAVKQLFINEQQKVEQENTGSESENDSLDDFDMDYQGVLSEHSLSDWTKNKENLNKLIQAPVLVSTIDHLTPATEGTRGDKHIPATLRLFTSDLIIDEPDDFGLNDLPALCRLVNWAGMLGGRVLLSTATMPPSLSNALFRAYKAGWSEYAKANLENWNGEIACAWFDEFNEPKDEKIKDDENYKKAHNKFVKERIKEIQNNKPKHLGEILDIIESNENLITGMAKTIFTGINKLHNNHKTSNKDKNISIGLVRMANIKPLVAVAKELLRMNASDNTCIHYCVYHSKFPLVLRSHIENKLDWILNRKNKINDKDEKKRKVIWKKYIDDKILNSNCKNHIFVVLASPVAEVGRDHDYDWAIIEPSSMRSIIQIAGRILRHRNITPDNPNILLLNKNYKALEGKNLCFQYPGFETKTIKMKDCDLNHILKENQYKNITAIERIAMPKTFEYVENNKQLEFENLVELEHKSLIDRLHSNEDGAKLWWDKNPTWCGEMQRQQPFRQSKKDNAYYLWIDGEYCNISWRYKNEDVYPAKFSDDSSIVPISNDELDDFGKNCGFWFDIEIENIYQKLAKDFNIELKEVSKKFGELRLVEYKKTTADYKFHSNLGVYKIIDGENDE